MTHKIKIDKTFISDLIAKSWQESESIQNQIASIEVDSRQATIVVKLLKDLLTSYYVFTGCLENIEHEAASSDAPIEIQEEPVGIHEEPVEENIPDIEILDKFDSDESNAEAAIEPFEYFVDFDEPTGEPLTDDDLYN